MTLSMSSTSTPEASEISSASSNVRLPGVIAPTSRVILRGVSRLSSSKSFFGCIMEYLVLKYLDYPFLLFLPSAEHCERWLDVDGSKLLHWGVLDAVDERLPLDCPCRRHQPR